MFKPLSLMEGGIPCSKTGYVGRDCLSRVMVGHDTSHWHGMKIREAAEESLHKSNRPLSMGTCGI